MHHLLIAGLVALTCCPSLCGQGDATRRPNFLFIIADDQSACDLRVYDPGSELDTPAIERLAAEGMVLDGAYHMGSWSGAVCTPSRHMVMSGRTVWHLPRRGIKGEQQNPNCPADLAEHTLAAVFNRAGYDTMRTCKKGNSYAAANAQFTVVHDRTCRQGTAEEGSAWHAERVLDYLAERERTHDRNPFLIYFGFSHPHDPRWTTPELGAKYGADNHSVPEVPNPKSPRLPANWLPRHPFPHGHPGLRDEVSVQNVGERRDPPTIRNERGRQFACSENIDRQVARVLDRLQAMGELDDTYVIYTADHGMAIGRHGLQGKQNLYEHTWRVPFIVRGPSIARGTRAQGNVYLLDVLATLCDLAGITPPASNEGRSFRAVLEGRQQTIRDVLYGVYCGGTKPGMRAVRKGDWKLIEYDVLDGQVHETQLFDLGRNPDEFVGEHRRGGALTDLAEDPRHADKLAELRALLAAEMARLDDPYRLCNQSPRTAPK
ncbi:MAG: sulfatase-like hydrolase/transferase [Planctomycetes bacterium]|nr:sulfatase-like hydrolase/transferase [Planctomycetota bacterium]